MASAHRAIHNMAIRHLEARQDCSASLPDDDRCLQAYINFANSLYTGNLTTALLDGICEEVCIGPLDDYFECLNGEPGYADTLVSNRITSTATSPFLAKLLHVMFAMEHVLILVVCV